MVYDPDMLREKVENALNDVRPTLKADGGDVELVDVTDNGVIKVKQHGACAGCPMANLTLTQGIERHLKNVLPDVKSVQAV